MSGYQVISTDILLFYDKMPYAISNLFISCIRKTYCIIALLILDFDRFDEVNQLFNVLSSYPVSIPMIIDRLVQVHETKFANLQ